MLASDTIATFVKAAQSQIGVPYLYGGESTSGFDCSGLVQWAAATAGVSLPRTAAAQYAATQRISTDGPPPAGSLVFFRTDDTGEISHVGISLGNWLMVDAPHTGAAVRVESFRNWPGYVGATTLLGASTATSDATAPAATDTGLTTESAGLVSEAENTLRKVSINVLFVVLGAAVVALGLYRAVQQQRKAA